MQTLIFLNKEDETVFSSDAFSRQGTSAVRKKKRGCLSGAASYLCNGPFTSYYGMYAFGIGTSLFWPHLNPNDVPFELLTIYHSPVDGRNTTASAVPSPSTSIGAGISPVVPQWKDDTVLVNELTLHQSPF